MMNSLRRFTSIFALFSAHDQIKSNNWNRTCLTIIHKKRFARNRQIKCVHFELLFALSFKCYATCVLEMLNLVIDGKIPTDLAYKTIHLMLPDNVKDSTRASLEKCRSLLREYIDSIAISISHYAILIWIVDLQPIIRITCIASSVTKCSNAWRKITWRFSSFSELKFGKYRHISKYIHMIQTDIIIDLLKSEQLIGRSNSNKMVAFSK